MYMVYDPNKKLLAVGDIYPKDAALQKGDHTIKLLLRHDDSRVLDKLRDMPLVVERKLKDPIPVSVYPTNSDAVQGSNAVKDFVLRAGTPRRLPSRALRAWKECRAVLVDFENSSRAGERRALFVGPLTAEDKLPKDALPGRLLMGKLKLGKLSELTGKKHAPAASTLVYTYGLPSLPGPPFWRPVSGKASAPHNAAGLTRKVCQSLQS